MLRRLTVVVLVGAAALAMACSGDSNAPDGGPDAVADNVVPGDSGGDATTSDAPSDAAPDAADAADASDSADAADAGTTFSSLSDTSKWSTYGGAYGVSKGFYGTAFDGRYVYFVPYDNGAPDGVVTRYDTTATFTTNTSWSIFDMTTVVASAKGFRGAAFDGRYVYFVPNYDGTSYKSIVVRYDTTATFTAGSWSTFDVSTVNSGAAGFFGAVYDGHYIYFVPNRTGTGTADGVVARYDTQASFTTTGSWTTFDTTTVTSGAAGFCGAVFDGRYVYLVPDNDGSVDGVVARYDTQSSFTTSGSWTTFDATTVNGGSKGFVGASFDGRYVYLAPYGANGGVNVAMVTRYDTTATFTATASWTTFDTKTVNASANGYIGSAFDGRYVYFLPYPGGLLARVDTQATFTTSTSWSTFDITTVNVSAKGFAGAAFDGEFLYFAPFTYNGGTSWSGEVARFDAKTPPALPAGYAHGSFL